jgi:predicted acyl esterase
MLFHGYAGAKLDLATMQPLLDAGYATFSMTTRGFGESCGTSASRTALGAACNAGYVRLMDTRYEVRDAQELAGLLADEGHTTATQIGAIGGSYGGGLSMALGALKNRKMLPNGSLVPWQSPLGTPMQIAAAAPEIPWTDIAYALLQNGSTLDYVQDSPYQGRSGVLKQSFENGLYNSGLSFNYAPAGADPDADLRNWHALFIAGEPYDDASGNPLPAVADIRDELTTHHSSYYIDHSQAPAPMLMSSGFTDDLFPADETIRFYNRTRMQYPSTPISLFYASLGHQRGQNKAADLALRQADELAWMNYYVRGIGSPPFQGVKALTQTCPTASAPSGGPYTAPSWDKLAPGEIRFGSLAAKTILPSGNSSGGSGFAFDPIFSGGNACATTSGTDIANTATYRMDPVPAGGFTLMGSPTVVSDITSTGSNSQVAARLLDVDTGANTETLVARALWRPAITSTPVQQVFQLHPNGYTFAAGHVVKLELLAYDNPYGKVSNGQANVTVQNLSLRLPVLETSGALGGLVQTPAPKVLPAGKQFAPGFSTFSVPGSASALNVPLVPSFKQCGTAGRPVSGQHPAPLAVGSCSPSPTATVARVGTQAVGSASLGANPGDVAVVVNQSDVRSGTVTGADYDPNPSGADMTAYVRVRLTDYSNGGSGNDPATTTDFDLGVPVTCVATVSGTVGSDCTVNTTMNAVTPGAFVANKKAVVQAFRVRLNDAGVNGTRGDGDDSLFEQQGFLAP